MAKLRLDLEAIRVESFAASAEEADAGTVNGHAGSAPLNTCAGQRTCYISYCNDSACIDSCLETCKITCGACITVEVCN